MKQIIVDSIQILDLLKESTKIKFSHGRADGSSLLKSMENQSFATVRSGGPALLSTILHRGMASRHIGVIWGGFNIQSVVNGTFDLSLVRNTFDRSKFYQNGTSAVTGNASIAGVLSLENDLFGSDYTSINISISSIKNKRITLTNKTSLKKYAHHLAINSTSNDNQYTYKSSGQKLSQKSAQFSLWDVNYEGRFLFSERFGLSGGAWLQNAERNIPPTKTSVDIKQEQTDNNYRAFLQLAYYMSNSSKLNLRTAYFDETIEYRAPGILSTANAEIINIAIDLSLEPGINLSTFYRGDMVNASFFQPTYSRSTFAFLADWKINIKSLEIGASVRPEWVDSEIQPLIVGLRLKRELSPTVSSSLRYNKGYTLPSFNDLYWPSGGNEDLKTERSHEIELGFNYQYGKSEDSSINFDLFINLIDDWIQWIPINGLFEPINQRKVRNLGFELMVTHKHSWSHSSYLKFNLLYAFTDSRLVKNYLNSDHEGKRTVFVPVHKITGQITYIKKSWQMHLKPLYYSKRYDSVDNSSFVSGFFILDLEMVRKFNVKGNNLLISLAIENGLNNDYENIKFYPMPLRIFRLGLDIKI
jgi:vitamin B12 transporter